ncbi:MAG: 4-hydroxy-tetrahydrodipicolinate reductase [Pseudomonadales bacterium]|jgi:4-hydroxy-tetrahydrodipicolinate reductase|nr:4-hydroxy-tetrahydrodipicolinate reductase [Pseudomonadales bacterium]
MTDSTSPVRVAVTGAAGRMGRMLVAAVAGRSECRLTAALERPGASVIGMDAGVLAGCDPAGVTVGDDAAEAFAAVDVVVDFTTPEASCAHAAAAAKAGCAIVIGTTGLAPEQHGQLDVAARHVPVVWAPNYSVGVNLTLRLLAQAAAVLGDDADVEIVEMHHRHKVDAPSGTALRMGEVLAATLGRDLDVVAEHGRWGRTGERGRDRIGFHALRGGDVVGDHTVVFAAEGERIEITHRASDRMTFAAGAVRAAVWAAGRVPGRYDMDDVLGLR